ncbi:flagellar export chaperone FliS [Azonexus sp. IMCC34839]|uniref:flagellar export chaperone FliS n=1 Tax=Azonexus sp. IMCC34839 TaxID=3133695 RepID=UPI003999E9CB
MLGHQTNPISAYTQVSTETSVNSADPHRLVLLLFEAALSAISIAQVAIETNDTATRGTAISKAIDIINNGLRASLDLEAGGELAAKLGLLYEYMCNRLLLATLRNDKSILNEVAELLSEIHEAWVAIGSENSFK